MLFANGRLTNCAVRLNAYPKAGREGLASPESPAPPAAACIAAAAFAAVSPGPARPARSRPHQANGPARAHTNAHAHADTRDPTHGPAPCAADTFFGCGLILTC